MTVGWKLDRDDRAALLRRFTPRYDEPVADHVTMKGQADETAPPPDAVCVLVGYVDDGAGVEAMVVEINGETARPDGSTFHITWSLAPNRRAVESNDVIASRRWIALNGRVPVRVTPARWP